MDNNGMQLNPESNPPTLPLIIHAPAVAVGHFNDGLASIWWGLVLNLTGLYPLIVFLMTLDDPDHMKTMISWVLVSLFLVIGTLAGSNGVKQKGQQKASIRIFGLISLSIGILFLLIPMFASLLYAFSTGN